MTPTSTSTDSRVERLSSPVAETSVDSQLSSPRATPDSRARSSGRSTLRTRVDEDARLSEKNQGKDASAPMPSPMPTADPNEELDDDEDPFLIAFEHEDPRNPRDWPSWRKWAMLFLYLLPEVWAEVISSIFAPATADAAKAVGVSEAAMRTVQAIYLYGFALGPVVLAPLSEDYGRKWVIIGSVVAIGLCQIPCALAGSIALMLPFRFVAGFFAAATFNSIGSVADMWDPAEQGWGVNSFALAAEGGAYLGAVIGGYILQNIGWRWTFGASGLGMALLTVVLLVTAQETRGGVILSRLAAKKRKETGDERYYCVHERQVQAKTWGGRLTETLGRPAWMLISEPIVMATSIFDGLNYMIIYGFILGFSLVYGNVYGFSVGAQNLPFLGVFVGALLAYFCLPLQQAWERRAARKSPTGMTPPEARLFWLATSPFFPISLFWFGWTAVSGVHWASSVVAAGLFGFISHIIFVAVSDYTTSCYSLYAASAIGAQSLLREVMSGSFTLFTVQMYENLGYPWASSLLGFLAAAVSVLPFLLYIYGPKLRARSPFCREQLEALEGARREEERLKERAESRSVSRSRAQTASVRELEAPDLEARSTRTGTEKAPTSKPTSKPRGRSPAAAA